MADEPKPEADIISHARFQPKADAPPAGQVNIEQLRAMRLIGDGSKSFDSLTIPEPEYGEEVVGELTDDETELYIAFHSAFEEKKKMERKTGGLFLARVGAKLQEQDSDDPVDTEGVINEEEAKAFFRAQRRAESLKAILYWAISERLGLHDWRMNIRTRRRIVKTKRQW